VSVQKGFRDANGCVLVQVAILLDADASFWGDIRFVEKQSKAIDG
jgi:hypothetical protein